MITLMAAIMRWLITWYTYLSTALVTLLIILVVYSHLSKSENVPADFASKKTGATFSLLSSNALRDVAITHGSQGQGGANIRLVNVQGISITPIQSTFFLLVGSSMAPR